MSYTNTFHGFSVELATEFSIEEAIIIHHFQHWVKVNKRNKKNFLLGRTWTYQTIDDIVAHFPYWSFDQIRRIIAKLVRKKILIKENFNKSKFEKTVWYAFEDEEIFIENSNNSYRMAKSPLDAAESPIRDGEIATSYIKDKDTKQDAKEERKSKKESSAAAPPPPLFLFKRVKMEKERYDALVHDFGEDKIKEFLIKLDEYADINPKRFKQYACHAAVIRKWLRDEAKNFPEKSSKNSVQSDEQLVKKLEEKYPHLTDKTFSVGYNYIEFIYPNAPSMRLKFGDAGFREVLKSQLRKMNLNLENL